MVNLLHKNKKRKKMKQKAKDLKMWLEKKEIGSNGCKKANGNPKTKYETN